MKRPVMSFGAFAAGFDGTDEQAQDVYADYMQDLRTGKESLEVSFDIRDTTPEPPALLNPESILRNRQRTQQFLRTGEWTWPKTDNQAGKAKE